jgi:hypothetical protein
MALFCFLRPISPGIRFLAETWRLAPTTCEFTSEVFYEGRLKPHPGCRIQKITGETRFAGNGLWFVPVDHDGNQNSSDEEAATVAGIVRVFAIQRQMDRYRREDSSFDRQPYTGCKSIQRAGLQFICLEPTGRWSGCPGVPIVQNWCAHFS